MAGFQNFGRMTLIRLIMISRRFPTLGGYVRHFAVLWLLSICGWAANSKLVAAPVADVGPPRFKVMAYKVEGSTLLSTNDLVPLFASYTGASIGVADLVKAASELRFEFYRRGYPLLSVAIAPERITNGIVTLNVFQTAVPQVVVDGECYLRFTNSPSSEPPNQAEIAQARVDLTQQMSELDAAEKMAELKAKDTRIHVVSTNAGPRFAVDKYLVAGNSVLSPRMMAAVLTNIDGAFGTNVGFEGIRTVKDELQRAYRERGYVTVAVAVPQQKLTNATVKLQVTEGRLVAIKVTGNRYCSSNNVMRALPSLHTNMLLNGPVFLAELNRANANQDRQIYPVIGPGPDSGSSALTLKVKDQLPVHGKVEFNNESSPGSPDLRVNFSAVANNLWQLDHSLGFQYGFSPELSKPGQWDIYDTPAVANYSAFYRLPLGNPEPIADLIVNNPDNFGYNEATHKFELPPPSGRPDLTFFASRSTIDNGVATLSSTNLYSVGGNSLVESVDHEDITINQDVGTRLSLPLQMAADVQSTFSGGLDFKTYRLGSGQTNLFTLTSAEIDYNTTPITTNFVVSKLRSPVPYTVNQMHYLPLAARYDVNWRDGLGTATIGLGLSANVWYDSSVSKTADNTNHVPVTVNTYGKSALQLITGSKQSSGNWFVLTPTFSHNFSFHTNWPASIRADGQWSSEPLISNEQYSIGGVKTVRGYHEGEASGDLGWHASLEQQTPSYIVGMAYGKTPLTIRGLAYMDYGAAYLLDPQGRPDNVSLWGTGFGLSAAVGSHWQSRFLVSFPLIGTRITPRDEPFFNFELTAQF